MGEFTFAGAPSRTVLLGTPVHGATMEQVLECCTRSIATRTSLSIGVVNAAKLVTMQRDVALRAAVESCDLTLADGQSVVWASRLLGAPLPERVAGIDLFFALLREASARGHRVFFLGARPEVLTRMVEQIQRDFTGLVVAGARHGYYAPEEEQAVADEIGDSRCDMLFLGMTSPRKELFVERYGAVLQVPVIHGVGGSFDVLAGVTRRAPLAWQAMGLEWLYRLLQEPRRLFWRYARTNTLFMAAVGAELVRGRAGQRARAAA